MNDYWTEIEASVFLFLFFFANWAILISRQFEFEYPLAQEIHGPSVQAA